MAFQFTKAVQARHPETYDVIVFHEGDEVPEWVLFVVADSTAWEETDPNADPGVGYVPSVPNDTTLPEDLPPVPGPSQVATPDELGVSPGLPPDPATDPEAAPVTVPRQPEPATEPSQLVEPAPPAEPVAPAEPAPLAPPQ